MWFSQDSVIGEKWKKYTYGQISETTFKKSLETYIVRRMAWPSAVAENLRNIKNTEAVGKFSRNARVNMDVLIVVEEIKELKKQWWVVDVLEVTSYVFIPLAFSSHIAVFA